MPPNLEDDAGAHAPPPQPRHWAWANLMRRAFDIDVLACPRCGGRLRLLGTIEDPAAIRAILGSLAASAERVDRAPPPVTPEPTTLATQVEPTATRASACVAVCSAGRQRAPRESPECRLPVRDRLTGPLSALYVGRRMNLYVGRRMNPTSSRTVAH